MGIATSVVQARLGNRKGAIELARSSHEQIRRLLGDDHPIVVNQALFIPRTLEEMGDTAQAVKLYHEAIDQLRNRQEDQSYAYARNVERLAAIASDARRFDEADTWIREALAIYQRCLRDDSWRVGWTLAQLGILQRRTGQYEAAIATLTQAVDIFKRVAADSPLNSVPWGQGQVEQTKRQLAAATKQ
jgi:tetratricopeptide (TPR) repeat protein